MLLDRQGLWGYVLPEVKFHFGVWGEGTGLDMQHLFTSAPMVKMHLKPVVGVLSGQRPLGALHPPLASVSLLGFFPLFSMVKAFDSQEGHQALYFPCLAKSGFLCYFEHFTPTYFPRDWSSLSTFLLL